MLNYTFEDEQILKFVVLPIYKNLNILRTKHYFPSKRKIRSLHIMATLGKYISGNIMIKNRFLLEVAFNLGNNWIPSVYDDTKFFFPNGERIATRIESKNTPLKYNQVWKRSNKIHSFTNSLHGVFRRIIFRKMLW